MYVLLLQVSGTRRELLLLSYRMGGAAVLLRLLLYSRMHDAAMRIFVAWLSVALVRGAYSLLGVCARADPTGLGQAALGSGRCLFRGLSVVEGVVSLA